MHIYFYIAGNAVKPWQLDTDWIREEDKAILKRIQASLEEKAGSLKCGTHGGGTHGEEITAIVSGPSYHQLGVEIKGCCDDFVEMVSKKLNPADIH
jgi:hypothetical protein